MSPLWPETIRLGIGPDALCLHRRGAPELSLPLGEDWAASLAGLPALPRRARLRVCVADRHVRYLRLVWPPGLRAEERAAFVSHRFQAVFGAGPWAVLADRDAICLPSLGAALPAGLLDAVKAFAAERRLRLTGCEPAFPQAYNALRARIGGDGALARLESGRVTLGLWQDGQWRAVRSQPVAQADGAAAAACLATLLATLPAGEAPSDPVLYLAGGDPALADLPAGWRCERVEAAA